MAVESKESIIPPVGLSGRNINEVVRTRWSHLEYRWKLDNFWELRALACVEALEDENGGLIWSQRFGDKDRGFWQLKLYPYGDLSPAGRGHVSLFLSLDLKSLEVPKAYSIFGCYLLDDEGQKVVNSGRSFTRQKFAEGSSSWGWSQFIKVEGQSLNRLLAGPSDSLIIKCEIEVFVGVIASPGRFLPQPKTWTQEMQEYLASPVNFDISCVCEGMTIRANRSVLCGRSKWFADNITTVKTADDCVAVGELDSTRDSTTTHALFATKAIHYASFGNIDDDQIRPLDEIEVPAPAKVSETVVKHSGFVHVNICSHEVLENIINFMHTEDCRYLAEETKITQLLELLIAARKLDVQSLYLTMTRRLCAAVACKPTAIVVNEVAKELGATDLADHCESYLMMCARELSDKDIVKALAPKSR